jgi:hypothetical protein
LVEPTALHPRKKKKKRKINICIWKYYVFGSFIHTLTKKQGLYVHSEDIAPSNVIEDIDLGENTKITS